MLQALTLAVQDHAAAENVDHALAAAAIVPATVSNLRFQDLRRLIDVVSKLPSANVQYGLHYYRVQDVVRHAHLHGLEDEKHSPPVVARHPRVLMNRSVLLDRVAAVAHRTALRAETAPLPPV